MKTADHPARSLYLEMRALGLELRARPDPTTPGQFRLEVATDTFEKLDPERRQQARDRLRANKAALASVLLNEHDLDLKAIRQEGNA